MPEKKVSNKAAATRQQLLDAALLVIGEKGYSAATVDEIVEVAGVSKGVAYYHFKSKAAMAESILEEGMGELIEEFEAIADRAGVAHVALTGMIEYFASHIFENKAFGRFFVSELWREGRVWSDVMRSYEHRLMHLIEGQLVRGKAEGMVRPSIDPAFEAVALVGMVLTTTLYYLSDEAPGNKSIFAGSFVREEPDVSAGDTSNQKACVDEEACSIAAAFSEEDQQEAKDAFIERICDFVRHANVRPELLQ